MKREYENMWVWLAWHLPRPLVYWCAIRLMVNDFNGGPGDQTCGDALKRAQGWVK